MKKLILFSLLCMFAITAFSAAKRDPSEYTEVYEVKMNVIVPIGEIKGDKIVFTNKQVEIVGAIECVTSNLYSGGKKMPDLTSDGTSTTTKFYWMTSETIRLKEATAIEVNEFNRAGNGKSSRLFSYCNSNDVTSTFSALNNGSSKCNVTWQFLVARGSLRDTYIGNTFCKDVGLGEFGYGHDNFRGYVGAPLGNMSNGYLQNAEGTVTFISDGCVSSVANAFFKYIKGLPQKNTTMNKARECGTGTVTIKRIPYKTTSAIQRDIEKYFYLKYDYSGVEVLDSLKELD